MMKICPTSNLVALAIMVASMICGTANSVEITFNNVGYRSFLNVPEKERYSFAGSSVSDFGSFEPASPDIPSGIGRSDDESEESLTGALVSARPSLLGLAGDPFFDNLGFGGGFPGTEARTKYFENKASVDTQRTQSFVLRSDPEEFGYAGNHSALAESRWVDTWVADETGVIELDYSFDAAIRLNDIISNGDFLVAAGNGGPSNFGNDLGIEVEDRDRWDFNLSAVFAVFNLDRLVEEDEESSELLPSTVASVEIRGSSDPIETPDGEFIDSPDALALVDDGAIFVNEAGTLSFLAFAGERYRVVGRVRVSSRNGVEVDAFDTFTLDEIRIPPGMDILSQAANGDGAILPIRVIPEASSTTLMASAMVLGAVMHARRRFFPQREHLA